MAIKRDLEERIFNFILKVRKLVSFLRKTPTNRWYGFQVNKSTSSMGANYAEATCALTRKDFINDINRVRKEAKESFFWLNLINVTNPELSMETKAILKEAEELVKIFQASVSTARKKI